MTDYADLTKFIAERIVSNPAAVTVEARPRGRSTIVTLQVAEEDMGKLIGKTGRNIEAVRAVVRAAGLRHHQRVQVELKDLRCPAAVRSHQPSCAPRRYFVRTVCAAKCGLSRSSTTRAVSH